MTRLTREFHLTHLGVSIDSIGTFSQLYWEFSVRRTFVCRPTNECLTGGKQSREIGAICNAKIRNMKAKCKKTVKFFCFAHIILHKIVDITQDYTQSCPMTFATSASPCRP